MPLLTDRLLNLKKSGIAAILITLCGCTAPTTTTIAASTSSPSSTTGNLAHDKLSELDPTTQALFLGKVVTSSGDPCRGTKSFFSGHVQKGRLRILERPVQQRQRISGFDHGKRYGQHEG